MNRQHQRRRPHAVSRAEGWMMHAVVCLFVLALFSLKAQDAGAKTGSPASRPTTQASPSTTSAPSATPRDAEVLKELIREVERQPVTPAKGTRPASPASAPSDSRAQRGKEDSPLHEGSAVVERTGRLARVGQV